MKKTFQLAIGLFVLCLATTSRAAIYDVHNDFSITNGNPNGFWTYGYSTTLTSPLILYPNADTDSSGNQRWYDANHISLGTPVDENNPTNNQQGLLPPNTTAFHPGEVGEFSHFVFTSPSTGLFSVSALFSPFDMGGTDVHILENGISIFSGEVTTGNPQPFNMDLFLTLGSTLDFAVGRGTDGTFYYDTTGIAATITSLDGVNGVPDAGMSASLLGLGLSGIVLLRRKMGDR